MDELVDAIKICFLETDLSISDVYEDDDDYSDLTEAMTIIAEKVAELKSYDNIANQIARHPTLMKFIVGKIKSYIEDSLYFTGSNSD